METAVFDRMTRDELVAKARALGVERPEVMTRVELRDEIVRRAEPDPIEQRRARGWLGVARDLVASVVESGLNLPDAAALIRGREMEALGPPAVATVTLAQIYAAQGHHARALAVLDEVLAREPDHVAARALRERFVDASRRPPEPPAARTHPSAIETEGTSVETPIAPEVAPVAKVEAVAPAPQTEVESAPPPPVETPDAVRRAPCLLVARAGAVSPHVVWDLGDAPAPPEGAAFAVRFVAFTPSPQGTGESDGELVVNRRRGRAGLSGVDPAALVRAALGYRRDSEFVPLVIASEVVVSNGSVELKFRPPTARAGELDAFERDLVLAPSV